MRPDPDTAGSVGSDGLWRVVGSAVTTAALVVTSAAVFYVATRDEPGVESSSGTGHVSAITGFGEVGGADILGFVDHPARCQSHEGMVMIGRTEHTVFVVCRSAGIFQSHYYTGARLADGATTSGVAVAAVPGGFDSTGDTTVIRVRANTLTVRRGSEPVSVELMLEYQRR
ncbi:hypothetical protein A5778_22290 [Mycolicibacterium monacense]|nr:hypothetical protein A5778_22290 [Mycolicibacterium monacense]